MWILMLDDLRDFKMVKIPEAYVFCERVLVKTYAEFTKIINERGLPSAVFLDHDLGPLSLKECLRAKGSGFNYFNLKDEKTGFDAARFLINYCKDNKKKLPKYHCHSMNHIGCKNILDLLNKHKEKENNGSKS